MSSRGSAAFGFMLAGAFVLFASSTARATAIAMSDITATNLSIASTSVLDTIIIDPYSTAAFAQAQNSLGELDQQFDMQTGAPSSAAATVTWANGSASGGASQWSAQSAVNLPGETDGVANSQGLGSPWSWFSTFTIACPGPGLCASTTPVDFSVDLSGNLDVLTDLNGVLAQTETIFNLTLDGNPVLFRDDLLSIGPNDHQLLAFAVSLTTTLDLAYDTPYALLLRVDSESAGINAPEPGTMTLLALGLCALGVQRRRVRA